MKSGNTSANIIIGFVQIRSSECVKRVNQKPVEIVVER